MIDEETQNDDFPLFKKETKKDQLAHGKTPHAVQETSEVGNAMAFLLVVLNKGIIEKYDKIP